MGSIFNRHLTDINRPKARRRRARRAERRVDVLCQCGWGLLAVPKSEVPGSCPVCGFSFPDLEEQGIGVYPACATCPHGRGAGCVDCDVAHQ